MIEELKQKKQITREDISTLLSSIGKPGEKQQEKIEAVKQLNRFNSQKFGLHLTLNDYKEF